MKWLLSAAFIISSSTAWSLSLKLEGTCAGKLADRTPVAFRYYSNFDGCRELSRAALSYQGRRERLIMGRRSFTKAEDIYRFGRTGLVFSNSTGNTTAKFHYVDSRGGRTTVQLRCDVRDYEYADCE